MKERIYRSIPFVMVFLGVFGVLITDELWVAIMSLAGVWLLPSPVAPTLMIRHEQNVSRETLEGPKDESEEEFRSRIKRADTITAPCVVMHGSAEPHVSGCDGWTFDQS